MSTNLTVVLRDEPGALASLGEVTVAAGVHLRGMAAFTGDGGRGFVHALVDDGDVGQAKAALEGAGLHVVDSREVLVVPVGPGGLVDVMIALSEANVNVDLAYTVNGNQLAIATDDFYNARDALS